MQPPHRPGFGPPYGMPPYGAPYQRPPYPPRPQGQYPYQRPPYGGRGPPPPRPAAPAPGPASAGGEPAKNTTLWVGKIASSIEPNVVRALLDACGAVKEWKPATDPTTGALKGFGFCTYREAEGVIVALDVLNGLVVDGQALALKCNSATDAYIQWFKANRLSTVALGVDGAAPESQQPSGPDIPSLITAAREKVVALIAERPEVKPVDATAAANEFLSSLGGGGGGDLRKRDRDRDGRGSSRYDDDRDRDRHRHRDRDRRDRDYDDRSHRRNRSRSRERHPEDGEIRREAKRPESPRRIEIEAPPQPPPATVAPSVLTKPAVRSLKRPLATAFNDEEEEDESEKKSRRFVPIQYSAEELKAVREGQSGAAPAPAPPAAPVDPAEERKKQLMKIVPKDKDALFAYPVKWDVLDSAPAETKTKLSGWIHKKIKSLVGDDAEGVGFADFIVAEVHAHHSADKILSNIQDVLDEDAVTFVMQLFKLIIYQTEELALAAQ